MTDRQWIALGVRIAGVLLFLYSLRYLSQVSAYYQVSEYDSYIPLIIITSVAVLLFAVALLMVIFPLTLAGKLIPGKKSDSSIVTESVEHIQASVLSVVGVILLAIRLPDLMFWFVYLVQMNKMERIKGPMEPDIAAPFITTFVEIAIALWLTFGSRGIVGIIRRFREAGIDK